MNLIDHGDVLDLRDIARKLREIAVDDTTAMFAFVTVQGTAIADSALCLRHHERTDLIDEVRPNPNDPNYPPNDRYDGGDMHDSTGNDQLSCTECGATVTDEDPDDVRDTIRACYELLVDLGYSVDASDAEAIADQIESYGENEPTMIAEGYFGQYAEQLADELAPSSEARDLADTWPYRHIDWKAAADELKQDYNEVEFDGHTYYVRSY